MATGDMISLSLFVEPEYKLPSPKTTTTRVEKIEKTLTLTPTNKVDFY